MLTDDFSAGTVAVISEAGDLTWHALPEGDTLRFLQTTVKGEKQQRALVDVVRLGDTLDAWVNDEGLYECGPNPVASVMLGFPVHGPVILAEHDEDGNTVPLDESMADIVRAWASVAQGMALLCSANVGGDPVNGCDEYALPGSDLCARHAAEVSA